MADQNYLQAGLGQEPTEWFVEVEFDVDSQTLADDAIERLQDEWDDWEPNDGDLEIVQIETLAPMAAAVAETASTVPSAIFRGYGTKILGVPYAVGNPATTTVTLQFVDDTEYTVPAGSELEIDGYAFSLGDDAIKPAGTTSLGGILVSANEGGVDANGLTGGVSGPITMPGFVTGVVVEAPTANGTDDQDDEDYQNSLSARLQLTVVSLVTPNNFERWAVIEHADIGRATAVKLSDRSLQITVVGYDGEPVAQTTKDQLATEYEEFRLVNTTFEIVDATYTTVDVSYTAKRYEGAFDPVSLLARIDEMLGIWLSPASYGYPKQGGDRSSTWVNDPVIRKNKLIDLIGDVDGVNYVEDVTISAAGLITNAAGNLTLPGIVALPRLGTINGTIT